MLREFSIIECSESLSSRIKSGENVTEKEEIELRALSIIACDKIQHRLSCHLGDLDYFLWTLGKEVKYRKVVRHVNKHTFYY